MPIELASGQLAARNARQIAVGVRRFVGIVGLSKIELPGRWLGLAEDLQWDAVAFVFIAEKVRYPIADGVIDGDAPGQALECALANGIVFFVMDVAKK